MGNKKVVDKIWNINEIKINDKRMNWLIFSCQQTGEVSIANDDDGHYSLNFENVEEVDKFIKQLIVIKEKIYKKE